VAIAADILTRGLKLLSVPRVPAAPAHCWLIRDSIMSRIQYGVHYAEVARSVTTWCFYTTITGCAPSGAQVLR